MIAKDIADGDAWARLTADVGGDSAFASDWFVRGVLQHFDPDERARLFIVVRDDGEWLGVLAAEPAARFGRLPLRHWQGLLNANQFVGGPLVRRGGEAAFWQQLLPGLDQAEGHALALPMLNAAHRVTRALHAHCAATGRAITVTRAFERAVLRPAEGLPPQSARRRARLRALERKLARDHGPVNCTVAASPAEVERWIGDFLAMELAGWKGAARSALASQPGSKALFADVVRAAFTAGHIRCQSLMAGGRPVAMSAFFLNGAYGFGFKCCYDESFASYAPGILLLQHIMALPEATRVTLFDSCSAPDEATINGLWPGRATMVDLCVATGGNWRYRAVMRARRWWHRLKPAN
ncbi:MAG: GNAT family N-acetyltransferase [Sphingopyxis sp.]|nr:GNAT family N-acetyltransferase [Sphingopyxis sp.]